MKHWTIALAIFTALNVIAGGPNDVNLKFGLTPAEAKKQVSIPVPLTRKVLLCRKKTE